MYQKPEVQRFGELRDLTLFGFLDFLEDLFGDFKKHHGHHHNTYRS